MKVCIKLKLELVENNKITDTKLKLGIEDNNKRLNDPYTNVGTPRPEPRIIARTYSNKYN